MPTAAGDNPPDGVPPQLAALADEAEPAAAFPPPAASVSPLPGRQEAGVAPIRKAWGSPPRRMADHGEFAFMDELGSAWPVPSRGGGPSNRKKPPQGPAEDPHAMPLAAAETATLPSYLTKEAVSHGASIAGSASAVTQVDPHEPMPRKDDDTRMWVTEKQSAVPVAASASRTGLIHSKSNGDPGSPRPLFRPPIRQQQARPPMQSGHRGRVPSHYFGGGCGLQHQRPRHQRNTGYFAAQQPAQAINEYGHPPPTLGLRNNMPDWGFNPSPNLQWGHKLQTPPAPMNAPSPAESIFTGGYFLGPCYPDGLPYCVPQFPPILRPQSSPWFMPPLPPLSPPSPLTDATMLNQPTNSPATLKVEHLLLAMEQQESENLNMRLRKQIEYYFSDQNLVKDEYLRTCMDHQGWISVHIIASFPRVKRLTRDVGLVLEALRMSPNVEVSGDKMRRRGEWSKWIIRRQPLSDVNCIGESRRDN